jgi:hypothetical protein
VAEELLEAALVGGKALGEPVAEFAGIAEWPARARRVVRTRAGPVR